MAKKKKQNNKQTPLQKQFKDRKKQLDKILKELGKDERIIEPKKLTTQYVESLKKISKNELRSYYDGNLSKRRSNVISNRLSASINVHETVTPQKNKHIDVIVVGNNLIDVATGEILDTFDEEDFSMVHPDHYTQWFKGMFPDYNISNLDSLKESYTDYIKIAQERFESVFEAETKGTDMLRKTANSLISEFGSDAFYTAIATMGEDFWMAIDIIAHYGDDNQVNISGSEMRVNLDFLVHELRMCFSA